MTHTLDKLYKVIEEREGNPPSKSYVAKLLKKGSPKICKKLGEEATEVVIAALDEGRGEVIAESADLLFHLSVLWKSEGITPDEVMAELESRMGMSGLDEKAARKAK